MSLKRLLSAVVLTLGLAPAAASADEIRVPLAKLLEAAGEIGYPPEWTGIWERADTLYDCEGNVLFALPTSNDTLCQGDPIDPQEGIELTCTGDATAPNIDITCTGSESNEGCVTDYTYRIEETIDGNDATYVITISGTYSGTCDKDPDECIVLRGERTRISSSCVTATEKASWGQVRTRYR